MKLKRQHIEAKHSNNSAKIPKNDIFIYCFITVENFCIIGAKT